MLLSSPLLLIGLLLATHSLAFSPLPTPTFLTSIRVTTRHPFVLFSTSLSSTSLFSTSLSSTSLFSASISSTSLSSTNSEPTDLEGSPSLTPLSPGLGLGVDLGRLLAPKMQGMSIYLTGMMGSGKSAVGAALALRLGTYTYLDTDSLITTLLPPDTSIATFFATEGEPAFRKLESDVLKGVHSHLRLVVSTGGGLPMEKNNWSYLQQGIVVFLDVAGDVLETRLSDPAAVQSRPVLAAGDEPLEGKISRIMKERRPTYSLSDITIPVSTSDEDVVETSTKVILAINRFIEENPPKWKVKLAQKAKEEGN